LTEKKVGKVKKVVFDVQGAGNFVRVRVVLDVRKVLARFVTISRGGQREFYQIKYEKLPRFCGACGFMGHSHLECGSGEFEEVKLKWGDFLKADWETWHGRGRGAGSYRGGRQSSGFGGGRGRGREQDMAGRGRGQIFSEDHNKVSWRFNALPNIEGTIPVEDEMEDTGTSPAKKDMEIEPNLHSDALAKRRLELGEVDGYTDNHLDDNLKSTPEYDMIVAGTGQDTLTMCIEKENERKRSKKDGANSSSLGSAVSREESVRSQ
jgi:hypothetical protein